jgi:hypothetical protein
MRLHQQRQPRKMPCVSIIPRWSAAAFALLFAGDAAADEVRFRLVNGTEFPIRSVVLSSANLNSWGPNLLGPPSIKPGDAREVTVKGVFVDCNVDLKVVFDINASEPVWQYLNICALHRIRLRFDAMSGVSTASYEE